MTRPRRMSGLEWLAIIVATLLVLLAVFMFVMAIVDTVLDSATSVHTVSVARAWTAALVSGVFATSAAGLVQGHLNRVYERTYAKRHGRA